MSWSERLQYFQLIRWAPLAIQLTDQLVDCGSAKKRQPNVILHKGQTLLPCVTEPFWLHLMSDPCSFPENDSCCLFHMIQSPDWGQDSEIAFSAAESGSRRSMQIIRYNTTACATHMLPRGCNKEYERAIEGQLPWLINIASDMLLENEILPFQNTSFILALKPLRPALYFSTTTFYTWLSLILRKADSSRSAPFPNSPNLRFPSFTSKQERNNKKIIVEKCQKILLCLVH